MGEIGLFMFGCCVFGIALASTMIDVIGPLQPNSAKNSKECDNTISTGAVKRREHSHRNA